MKNIFSRFLARRARKILRKYKPRIIGVTGSVGKTSAKEAIFVALGRKFKVRRNLKNYNNEFGLPLTIIGANAPGRNIFKWLVIILKSYWITYIYIYYPQVLVLEMGVDRPGDMDYLRSIAQPDVAVFTAAGVSHLEFFGTPERIVQEKVKIFEGLSKKAHAVLNADDPKIRQQISKIHTNIITYGFSSNADLRVVDYKVSYSRNSQSYGALFRISYRGEVVPIFLDGTIGIPHILACAAAAAVGLSLGLSLTDLASNLHYYSAEPGRLRLIPGLRRSIIIDDTYNAAPNSVEAAVHELAEFPAPHKIAVLGDMLELGRAAQQSHKDLARLLIQKSFDYIIGVGPLMQLMIKQLQAENMPTDRLMHFENPAQAIEPLKKLVGDGTALLVKGSQGIRMEKIVKALMNEPQKAGRLLCRQDSQWLKK